MAGGRHGCLAHRAFMWAHCQSYGHKQPKQQQQA
eukprot:CAMPEP_0172717776 /NCGR_PEP_ID=MMETSP1074-20121228/72513_1 /TAXON_ID=2916 /ORGANISM="Ceratium fusus, Strain PA161109" /LENGTH=33 /DNA_ID= /DNA_START= /DNA_END= /DNA_ORIENTATION=